jgi:hypothetical protein
MEGPGQQTLFCEDMAQQIHLLKSSRSILFHDTTRTIQRETAHPTNPGIRLWLSYLFIFNLSPTSISDCCPRCRVNVTTGTACPRRETSTDCNASENKKTAMPQNRCEMMLGLDPDVSPYFIYVSLIIPRLNRV